MTTELDTKGDERYFRTVNSETPKPVFRGFARLIAGSIVLACAVSVAQETVEGTPRLRQTTDDPLETLFFAEQCVPGRPDADAMPPREYPRLWSPARRRGLNPIVTTLYNVHSREALPVFKGQPIPQNVLDHLFRCRGFATSNPLDPRLLEMVLLAADHFDARKVNIISAYRSPKFNDALTKKGRRVASESKHTRGEAIDFGIPGIGAARIGTWLWDKWDGGVGTYRNDGFVHIDVGLKRRWTGK